MNKIIPGDASLRHYIDYYWIIEDFSFLTKGIDLIYDFPSLSPEMVIVLNGQFNYSYKGKYFSSKDSILFSFIDENLKLFPQESHTILLIKFKNAGLSSIYPFINIQPKELIKSPVIEACKVFGHDLKILENHLKLINKDCYSDELDEWFLKRLDNNNNGLIKQLVNKLESKITVKKIGELTNTSYSTIERHFKKEAGISPKQFLMLNRFKCVMEEFYLTGSKDWMEYVVKYNFHDQNHFIKEVKRFSGFTPNQLLSIPGLMPHRPEI